MDETLTRVSIDVSNRPYLIWRVKLKVEKLGEMDTELLFLNQSKNVWIIVRAYDLENLFWYLFYRIPSHLYLLLQQYWSPWFFCLF